MISKRKSLVSGAGLGLATRAFFTTTQLIAKEFMGDNLFSRYSTNGKHLDGADIERFCLEYLHMEPSDLRMLVFCYNARASCMGVFTKQEFLRGCSAGLNPTAWANELKRNFQPIYQWTGLFARQPGLDYLEIDCALDYWRLFSAYWKQYPLTEDFLKFAGTLPVENTRVTRDAWNSVPTFLKTHTPESLKAFNLAESFWADLLDEFIIYYQQQHVGGAKHLPK